MQNQNMTASEIVDACRNEQYSDAIKTVESFAQAAVERIQPEHNRIMALAVKRQHEIADLRSQLAQANERAERAEKDLAIAKVDADAKYARLDSDFSMYRKAWWREMGDKGFAKSHDIDALVLTTRYHFQKANVTSTLISMLVDVRESGGLPEEMANTVAELEKREDSRNGWID